MKNLKLTCSTVLLFAILSCSNDNSTSSSQEEQDNTIEESENVGSLLNGQWITEGNEGIVSNWLEFDSSSMNFFKWHSDEKRPLSPTGKYQIVSDSILELSYHAYTQVEQYEFNSIDVEHLDINSLGVNAGNLVYTKSIYDESTVSLMDTDTTTIEGTLLAINESDFWGRVYLTIDINGEKQVFDYYSFSNTEHSEIEKLINKKVILTYYTEILQAELDFHYNGKSIHGDYAQVKTENDKKNVDNALTGEMVVNENDISGDLPSSYLIKETDGKETTISAFVYQSHLNYNGKTVTVYSFEEHNQIAISIEPSSEMEQFKDDPFIGKWKKENTNDPIDPTSFVINKDETGEYQIQFSNEDYFVDASLENKVLKGKSNSGNFSIDVISKNPTILSYSDDGRGHFEPVQNERFVKE